MARLVRRLTGRPKCVVVIPNRTEPILRRAVRTADALLGGRLGALELTGAAIAGGFLALHVSGAKADRAFGLTHGEAVWSIYEALEDHRRAGRCALVENLAPAGLTYRVHFRHTRFMALSTSSSGTVAKVLA